MSSFGRHDGEYDFFIQSGSHLVELNARRGVFPCHDPPRFRAVFHFFLGCPVSEEDGELIAQLLGLNSLRILNCCVNCVTVTGKSAGPYFFPPVRMRRPRPRAHV